MLHALALRAAAQPPGALRDKLLEKLQERASRAPLAQQKQDYPALANPMAELLALLPPDASQELRHVRIHQSSWRQLRVAQSMADLRAPVTGHLGPLNGQALATRMLQQVQSLAPDYLLRLLTQMDAISSLEQLQVAGETERPARAIKKKAPERRR
ncbi:DUF2894 domain-containing protein [Paucibacter sp. Y2R2-4]|uniref:DUF2894 domain-containing protein n=1 Tax=Paucibacter sp. Y2R2-4 TaxID=2893553 RepID=UPI0021E4B8FD|nr:DUF2894 domain-containing protein [Paucibacter sp. Y2R2-4]MCV2348283.1 DUF2894 domain-containing protein [Paucibacter sp. Y2R2-4]